MSVSKIINKIVFSDIEPENPYVLWMVKDGKHYNFRYFQDGIWEPILVTKEELEALIETSLEIKEYIELACGDVLDITEEVLTGLNERLVAKPLPDYNTEALVDTLYGENSLGIYAIELGEGELNTYPANKFTLEVLLVNNYTYIHRMYFGNIVASRYKNEGVEWSPWVRVGDNLASYLTSDNAQSTYATLEQVGNIDIVLDILNGDLEGDIQEIIDNMAGV